MADYLTYIVTIATNQPAFEFEESESEGAWKFLRRLNDNKFVPDTDKELKINFFNSWRSYKKKSFGANILIS